MESGTTIQSKSRIDLKKQRKSRKHLPRLVPDLSVVDSAPEKKGLTKIVCLTTYPPRACGIATYSEDLQQALSKKFGDTFRMATYALESGNSRHHYPVPIEGTLNTDSALDFLQAAYYLNSDPDVGVILVQHEFGLFNNSGPSFYEFLEYLDKPVVVTLHTVLPDPSVDMRQKVSTIASLSEGLIVMTRTSAKILTESYGIPSSKIQVIPHGTHLVEYKDKNKLKIKYKLEGKSVLSTFGLLGPGKSIETTLDALPKIVAEHPDTVFLVIGRTHPTLVKEKGEAYREFLLKKVDSLNIRDHVRFIDEFVPLGDLLEYLQLTDIYLFTSKDPNQAVSGTFAYAMSCGCPIISTPIPHALEELQNGAGTIIDFEDSGQMGQAVNELLENPEERHHMRLNGLQSTSASAWENSAIAHANLFVKVADKPLDLTYTKPPIDLKHVKKMTTPMGIIQFSKINRPDIESGYTLDDNARAMVALCQHFQLTQDESDLKYIKIYFDFVYRCFRHDGKFLNYVDKESWFTDQNESVNLEDACGRAIWALGYLLSISQNLPSEYFYIAEKAKFVFEQALDAMADVRSPRAIAFLIKGLYYYNQLEERQCIDSVIRTHAKRLVSYYNAEAEENWHWFESYLTYGNSVLPEALLMAYVLTLDHEFGKVAKESFDFLVSNIFNDGMICVVSNQNWHQRGETFDSEFKGGEQPIDVAYTVMALRLFHKIYPQSGYDTFMQNAFDWFLGKNPLHQSLYNPCTGGCYDGLERHNVNLNQGAESTISYLLARLAMENFERS